MRSIPCATPAILALLAGSAALAQPTITPLVLEGDNAAGVGAVTAVNAIGLNDSGSWLVLVDTDNPDTMTDSVVLRDGSLFARENDPVAPAPAAISSFDSVNLNNAGNVGWNLFLRNTGGSNNDSGLYFNNGLILQEGSVSTSPAFTPGTPYVGFFEGKFNDSSRLFVVASVDDPNINSSVDRALVWVTYFPNSGVYTENVVAKEGDVLPGVTDAVTDFGTTEESFAIDGDIHAMYCASLTGDSAANGVLCRDHTLIARKGDESPIPGRTYTDIGTSTKLDMNNNLGYVFKATISGDTATNSILVRDGALFKSEGGPVPGVPGETITSFGTGPVHIDDAGNVIWYAQFTGDTATNQGLFINDTLLVRKGVTQVNGQTVTTIAGTTATGGITDGFAASRNGGFILFRGVLDTTTTGAFLISLGQQCIADFNRSGGTPDDADVSAFFTAWNDGDPSADVNASGGTPDDADIAFFFTRWNAGC